MIIDLRFLTVLEHYLSQATINSVKYLMEKTNMERRECLQLFIPFF